MTPSTILADPDVRDLLAALRAEPEEDTPRLALADRLDELGGTEVCEGCKAIRTTTHGGLWPCRKCGAKNWSKRGRTPDLAASWAELIRGSVEYARGCETCEYGDYLSRRKKPERKCPWCTRTAKHLDTLRARVETRLRRMERCETCGGTGSWGEWGRHDAHGFHAMGKSECLACHATGWSGPLARTNLQCEWSGSERIDTPMTWLHALHWHRGIPTRVDATLAEWWNSERNEPSKFARAVAAWMPSAGQLWVTDREPWARLGDHDGPNRGQQKWDWDTDEGISERVITVMAKMNPDWHSWFSLCYGFLECPSPDLARAALAEALARLAVGHVLTHS